VKGESIWEEVPSEVLKGVGEGFWERLKGIRRKPWQSLGGACGATADCRVCVCVVDGLLLQGPHRDPPPPD